MLAELGKLREIHAEIARQRERAERTEDDALATFHADGELGDLPERLRLAEREWDQLLLRLYGLNAPRSQHVCLFVFAESRTTLADLVNGYRSIARQLGLAVAPVRYRLPGAHPPVKETEKLPPQAHKKHPAAYYWHGNGLFAKDETPHRIVLWREGVPADVDPTEKEDAIGFGFAFAGANAHLRFSAEAGWHQFDKAQPPDADTADAMVFASSDPCEAFVPDEKLTRKGNIGAERARRSYNRQKGTACDFEWIKIQPGPILTQLAGGFPKLLAAAVETTVRVRLMQMIVE